MSISIYVLCTYLLSAVGMGLYFILRSRYGFKQRKVILASIVGLSLLIPAATVYLFPAQPSEAMVKSEAVFG